jgi:flagellar biogenesis protein FliO
LSPGDPVATAEGLPSPIAVDLWGEIVRVGGFLLVFFVFAMIIVRVGRRWNPMYPGKGANPVQVVGGCSFSPGSGVRLVRVGSRTWLVGVSREQISLLAEIEGHELGNMS